MAPKGKGGDLGIVSEVCACRESTVYGVGRLALEVFQASADDLG